MAELSVDPVAAVTLPSLGRQLGAVGRLRWRIYLNGYRRKGGVGNLIASILLVPVAILFLFGPSVGATLGSFFFVRAGAFERLSWILWGAFALTQLYNINLGQPGTTFDPTELLRFPISVRNYIVLRLFFGLASPANATIMLMTLGIAAGATAAEPTLWWMALVSLAVFGVTNVLFSQMIFAWVNRWISTRRAREIFTALIFILSLGFQWVNVTFNPGLNHRHGHAPDPRVQMLRHAADVLHPALAVLPPGLTAGALEGAHTGHPLIGLARVLATAAFGALFLAIFGLRIRTEYRGENLSDPANAVAKGDSTAALTRSSSRPFAVQGPASFDRSSPFAAVFLKEFLTLRRNVGVFYGLIAPAVMVFLFAGRLSLRGESPWILPAAAAYALLGVAPMTFNSFGLEGAGAQLYFLAPVPLRDVFLAKNLLAMLIGLFELSVVIGIICYVSRTPTLLAMLIVLLWAVGTLLCTTTVGNFMSIRSPKKINPGRAANKQAGALSSLLSMGILIVSATLAAGGMLLDEFLFWRWAPLATSALIALTGGLLYALTMPALERFAMNHRDNLFEELGKKT